MMKSVDGNVYNKEGEDPMKRIDESAAAKAYVAKLTNGSYPLERAKNDGVDYSGTEEERDTEAVREFTKSALFEAFKEME